MKEKDKLPKDQVAVLDALAKLSKQGKLRKNGPELDEQEITAATSVSPAPISAFAVADQDRSGRTADLAQGTEVLAVAQKTKTPLHLGSFFDSMLPSATAATVAIVVTLAARTEQPVTSSHFYGLLLGMLFATTFGLLFSKAKRLAGEHINLVSRSTFGVWGSALPALGVLLFKLVAIAALVLALASPVWRAYNLYAPLVAGALRPTLWPELAVVGLALVILLVLSRFKWMSRWIFAVVSLGLLVVAIANFNPAAFTHYSYAIRDAVTMLTAPIIEVHLSNPLSREEFRHTSVISGVVKGSIAGFGVESYNLALIAMQKLVV